jgi:site-specific recombinase
VSFFPDFMVALRSRNVPTSGRSRIYSAIGRRLWTRPLSFIGPATAR